MALGWTCIHCGDSGITWNTTKGHYITRVICYPCTYVLLKLGLYDDDPLFFAEMTVVVQLVPTLGIALSPRAASVGGPGQRKSSSALMDLWATKRSSGFFTDSVCQCAGRFR